MFSATLHRELQEADIFGAIKICDSKSHEFYGYLITRIYSLHGIRVIMSCLFSAFLYRVYLMWKYALYKSIIIIILITIVLMLKCDSE